jgi:uncharacterized delta-60 repeat protein
VGTGNDRGFSVIQQADAKIVVCGAANNGANNDFAVTRYNPDGTLDGSFGLGGVVTTPIGTNETGQQVIQQPDGKILVGGFSNTGANFDFALVRYNINGTLDASFAVAGIFTTPIGTGNDQAFSIALQPDGKIVMAGGTVNGATNDFAVIRLDSSGTLDPTFDIDGIVTTDIGGDDIGRSVQIQTDGRIVVAGWGSTGIGTDVVVVRYMGNGALDATWGVGGIAVTPIGSSNDQAFSLAIQPDDKILVSGLTNNGSDSDFVVLRYSVIGVLDPTFDTDGIVTTDFTGGSEQGYSLAVANDDKILVAGQTFTGTNRDFAVARYNPDGSLDVTFDGDGLVNTDLPGGNNDVGWAVAIQADARVVVAGSNNLSGSSTFGVSRYLVCEIVDTSLTYIPADSSLTANGSGALFQWVNCDSTYSIIPGETNQSYLITANGSFAVVITTTTDCSDTSSCFTIMNLSSENYHFDNTMMVFPNPTRGPMMMVLEKPLENASVNLINLNGQVVLSKSNLNGYKFSFDITDQPVGIYMMQVTEGSKSGWIKVVKY